MTTRLMAFQQASRPLPDHNRLWPLYGAGLDNLGRNGRALDVPMPQLGPDELLVRHDACALCSSDVKVVRIGEQYPKIRRKMSEKPVVLGHELSLTVARVGANLQETYRVGDRFTMQPDLYIQGVSYAYGVELQGGLSHYGVVDWHVLKSDEGNGLVPLPAAVGYVAGALAEPWACVTAAYSLRYRSALKAGGTAWIIGTSQPLRSVAAGRASYTIGAGFDAGAHPARVLLTHVPAEFEAWLRACAAEVGAEVIPVEDAGQPSVPEVDDIVLLGADPGLVEATSPRLASGGVFAIVADAPMPRPVHLDVGRIHYNRWTYVGGTDADVSRAYRQHPVRSELKSAGRAWFVGAGGPMGRMHVQRAIQISDGPQTIVCTELNRWRLRELMAALGPDASAKGIELIGLDSSDAETCRQGLAPFRAAGFDDIVVLAPVADSVAEAAAYAAPGGVINVFAGLARGTTAAVDLSAVYLQQVRYIGQSGSRLEHMRTTLALTESGRLSPSRSLAAVGSLDAARDGLKASAEGVFSGRVVIFPHIRPLALTALPDLASVLPSVYTLLKDGREWTPEAEAEFLELMLLD